ncbi:MAG: hydrogenase [Candidatus Bathyarchaeota archaeon B26-1]|nr:MAG: hydrogenase [Candidatus Bathyarchaeota archaeon B26-1]
MRLPAGKVPPEVLEEIVFKRLGVESGDVLLGPSKGEDGAVIKVGGEVLVSSMDPITGAVERLGWLAVNINANDVATFGIKPRFFSSCILLPSGAESGVLREICDQIDSAAKKLGVAVIGGHSEVTPGLKHPIVVGYAFGVAEEGRYVTSGGAEAGDVIILTKGAGIEGTAILASERRERLSRELGEEVVKAAESFYERISVVEDALTAFKAGGVTAMHDPTEGGVAGGIHEIADASGLGFEVFEEKIPVAPETSMICSYFNVDPLQLIGSGALLISVKPEYAGKVLEALESRGIRASKIGRFLPDPEKRIIVRGDGRVAELVRPVSDHLWKALER